MMDDKLLAEIADAIEHFCRGHGGEIDGHQFDTIMQTFKLAHGTPARGDRLRDWHTRRRDALRKEIRVALKSRGLSLDLKHRQSATRECVHSLTSMLQSSANRVRAEPATIPLRTKRIAGALVRAMDQTPDCDIPKVVKERLHKALLKQAHHASAMMQETCDLIADVAIAGTAILAEIA